MLDSLPACVLCASIYFETPKRCIQFFLVLEQRIEMLIEKVKVTQEREVPELMRRLAAVETFQTVGDEVRFPFDLISHLL